MIQSWDESIPLGSDDMSAGDNSIRNFKTAIRERLAVDHNFFDSEAGQANVGAHKWVTLIVQSAAPASASGIGFIYSKTVAGKVELFYVDSSGTSTQITSAGSVVPGTLDSLSDVEATTPALRDSIYFDTADSKWKKGNAHAVYA